MTFVEILNTYIVPYGLKLLLAIAVWIVGFAIAKWIGKLISKSKGLAKTDPNTQNLIGNIVKTVIRVVTILTVVMILGVPEATVLAVLGSAGLAIGLALQGGLSNIAAGIVIMICKPFHVGDFIITGEATGVVQEIGMFYTKVLTPDNILVTVPNGSLSNATVTNLSAKDTRRVAFDLNVAYDTDIELVKKVLLAVAQSNDLVLKEPESQVFIHQHDTSALGVKLRIWCKSSDYWTVYFDMWEDVKKAFDKFGIEIPYQHINVIVDKDEEE